MRPAARSLFAFGIYVTVAALAFLIAPAALTRVLRFPPASEGWVRTVGLLALVIGAYDLVNAWAGTLVHIRASVWLRYLFALGVTALVVTGQMTLPVIAFAVIDAAGATWTWAALKRE